MQKTKQLILIRHGHAENNSATGSDIARKLSSQGISEALRIGQIIVEKSLQPDLALCSSSTRTRETFDVLQKVVKKEMVVEYQQKIYSASEGELIAQISSVSDDINSLMIIGHNPSLHQLAIRLAKQGDKKIREDLLFNFPPCSLAVFSFTAGWQNLESKDSKIIFFTTPLSECV